MTFNTILNFVTGVFGVYASSNVFNFVILPIFCLSLILILLRVVKFIVSVNI